MCQSCSTEETGQLKRRTVELKMMPGFAKALQLVSTPFTNVMLGPTA